MNHRLLANTLAICALVLSLHGFAAELGQTEFTDRFVFDAKTHFSDAQVKVLAPLRVQLKMPSGSKYTAYLDDAYSQYLSSPATLDAILRSQIETIKPHDQSMSAKASASIFAVLKSRDYIAVAKRQLAQAGFSENDFPMVYEKLNEDLFAFYVFDDEKGMSFITKRDLAEIQVREHALRAISRANLEKYFDRNHLHIKRLQHGAAKIYAVAVDENYEASTLLVPRYWNKSNFDVPGKIVVYVPARNVVLVTGSEDAEGVRIASQIAKRGHAELGYAISPEGYVFEAGGWVRFEP